MGHVRANSLSVSKEHLQLGAYLLWAAQEKQLEQEGAMPASNLEHVVPVRFGAGRSNSTIRKDPTFFFIFFFSFTVGLFLGEALRLPPNSESLPAAKPEF